MSRAERCRRGAIMAMAETAMLRIALGMVLPAGIHCTAFPRRRD